MRRNTLRILLYGLGAIAIVIPIVAAIWLAEYESVLRQQDRSSALADELLQRAEHVTEQIGQAIHELTRLPTADPCADAQLARMRALVIESYLLLDVGYSQGNVLRCSSFGREAVDIGPASYTGGLGYQVRVDVPHPLAPEQKLIIVTDPKSGYTALVSEQLIISDVPNDANLVAGLINAKKNRVLAERGAFRPEWIPRIGNDKASTFYDGRDLVTWRRSARFDIAAYVAIGRTEIERDQRRILLILLPVGIFAAAILLFVVMRLTRLQTSMPSLLREALRDGKEFFLLYQPIVDLKTGSWCGCEALLRWQRPNGELINPDLFIPIAEQNQLMPEVTRTVLGLLERDILEREAGPLLRSNPKFYIAINLSAEDFCSPDLVGRLQGMIQRARIDVCNLRVEATERVFMNIEASRETLRQLRTTGIKVAIDDFGTGYSSLSYLHSLEADWLKIDKGFIDTIGTHAVTSEVIRHIIEMAQSLRMAMVAEGVETEEQASYLRSLNVQCGQGWLFGRPMPIKQFARQMGVGAEDTRRTRRVADFHA